MAEPSPLVCLSGFIHMARMTKRRKATRRVGLKTLLSAVAIVAALFVVGDRNPQLRATLEDLLQQVLTGEPARERLAGPARIIDGDTLDLDGSRIRMFGIDAPESSQTCRRGRQDWACGIAAAAALREVVSQQVVRCEEQNKDRYGRTVAVCWAGSRDLNSWMVSQGWAVAYRQYGGAIYDPEELIAKATQRGIWSSRFVMPWDWRRGER